MKKKNNIIDNIKEAIIDFIDWYNYTKDYKKTMQIVEQKENTIDGLKIRIENKDKKIEELKKTSEIKDKTIDLLLDKITELKQKISEMIKGDE